ncbi:predicted protein [Sclerotinia sclerotiorum 1980 UF-70]|uniref:Uncharacterized protein n=2 Tax=Sclerotinia sclerotiorum (strain ATCC 18683 / 1980 / Ss-1) TaxID=665079 RepID=A7EZZ4_SCLS1|nr:predicted protein [Sclerotinia sclerotiorum 1980 UF-70]APA12122.1 hypothetical protein sscle_09g068920 [Sclerotinia sclerotiorum 1980 UF-70]EDN95036.1 predicted protein [Sclerotinia sclerotiorum 1980 UF-70]
MSPTGITFRKQVDTLLNELSDCIAFCNQIRETRRLGSKHENFDKLEDTLLHSHTTLSIQYDTLQRCFGHRMAVGDDASVQPMNKCLRAISSDIKRKLYEIANKTTQTAGSRQLPGFGALLQHWKLIEEDASNIIIGLSQRLIITPPASTPVPSHTLSPKQEPQIRSDQTVVSKGDFNFLLDHMQNSWTERWSNEQLIYVNCCDQNNRSYEKPEGFIKAVPASYTPARTENVTRSRPSNGDLTERERRSYAYGGSNRSQREEFRRQ